jgi:hypothetical protein
VWESEDGRVWDSIFQLQGVNFADIIASDQGIVVVGSEFDVDSGIDLPVFPRAWISADGRAWRGTALPVAERAYVGDVVLAQDGTLIAIGFNWDRNVPILWTSEDAQSWAPHQVINADIALVDNTEIYGVIDFASGAVMVGHRFGGVNGDIAIVVWEAPDE